MLKITGEGRKAALDLRLVLGAMPDNPEFKVNHAAREIFAVWQETKDQRLAQLVFCDLSTPKSGGREFSVYDDLKAKLIANGVPAPEIAFIQEHDSDAAKTALFKDVRSGRVRILLGSTQKMGAGMNVQTAGGAASPRWRRGARRTSSSARGGFCGSNGNATVRILRYVTVEVSTPTCGKRWKRRRSSSRRSRLANAPRAASRIRIAGTHLLRLRHRLRQPAGDREGKDRLRSHAPLADARTARRGPIQRSPAAAHDGGRRSAVGESQGRL